MTPTICPGTTSVTPSRFLLAQGEFDLTRAFVTGVARLEPAVCHGPAALVNITLSDGTCLVADKEVSAFTNDEESAVWLSDVVPFLLQTALEERGARHVGAANFQSHVSIADRLVTGQNPASATGVADQVVKVLTQSA